MPRPTRKNAEPQMPQIPPRFTRKLTLEDWLSEDEIGSYDPGRGDYSDFWHKLGAVARRRRRHAWNSWVEASGIDDSLEHELEKSTEMFIAEYLYAYLAPRVRRTDRAPTYDDVPKVDPSDPEAAREMMRPKSVPIYHMPHELERELEGKR